MLSDFTFTSPTVYLSYAMLYASDSCGGIGPTFRNTIIPLTNTNDLSSLSYFPGDQDLAPGYKTASFNLTDLIKPIPNSIYDKDPRCQSSSWMYEFGDDGVSLNGTRLVTTSTFSCTRTAPYAPIIAVPPDVLSLDPAWSACTAWSV